MRKIKTHKKCPRCQIIKEISSFYIGFSIKRNKRTIGSQCIECTKLYNQNYYQENDKQAKEYSRVYRQDNKSQINEYQKQYKKNLKKVDPMFKLRCSLSTSIYRFLKQNNSSKNNQSCLTYLSYTINELKQHLEAQFEPWMNWNNLGSYSHKTWNDNDQSTWVWQVDHIIPHSTFNYANMDCQEFRDCWALNNLRPYPAKQNIIDGARRAR